MIEHVAEESSRLHDLLLLCSLDFVWRALLPSHTVVWTYCICPMDEKAHDDARIVPSHASANVNVSAGSAGSARACLNSTSFYKDDGFRLIRLPAPQYQKIAKGEEASSFVFVIFLISDLLPRRKARASSASLDVSLLSVRVGRARSTFLRDRNWSTLFFLLEGENEPSPL